VKADGLAAGKGVMICKTHDDAIDAAQKIMVDRIFGNAGKKVVIEECLVGEEASFLAFTDGKTVFNTHKINN
jgi:Phosphoribosylamine-glycine ligase